MTLRLWGILGGSLAVFIAVMYVVHIFELAGEAKTAKAELASKVAELATEKADRLAKETANQELRIKYAELNRKWSRSKNVEKYEGCTFDDDVVGLLESAGKKQ